LLNLDSIFFTFQLGVFAYIVTCVLTKTDYIFSGYDDLLANLEQRSKHWKKITYPLGRCEKCFGGQAALWVWLDANYELYLDYWFTALVQHSLFISFTIFFVIVVKTFFRKWK